VTTISHVERDDLPCLFVQRDPGPLFIRFVLHEAPHLVRFHLQTSNDHIAWRRHRPCMEMVRQHGKATAYKVHEPPDTDVHRTADAM
jgi:hypothetical protein